MCYSWWGKTQSHLAPIIDDKIQWIISGEYEKQKKTIKLKTNNKGITTQQQYKTEKYNRQSQKRMLHRLNICMLRTLMESFGSFNECSKIILFETLFNLSSPCNKRLPRASFSKLKGAIAECLQADQRNLYQHSQKVGSAG